MTSVICRSLPPRPPADPRLALLQSGHREGVLVKPFWAKKSCSPWVNVKLVPQSRQLRVWSAMVDSAPTNIFGASERQSRGRNRVRIFLTSIIHGCQEVAAQYILREADPAGAQIAQAAFSTTTNSKAVPGS